MRIRTGTALAWILAAALSLSAPQTASADAEVIFSIEANQYGDTTAGGLTLQQHAVYHSANGVTPFLSPFVPMASGIDALATDIEGGVLFSVERRGLVQHAGGLIMLEHDRVYRYSPQSATIVKVPDWTDWGINIAGLDALDRRGDGALVFSTESYVWVTPSNGPMTLRPENAYAMDPVTGSIEKVFDGVALGIGDLDGVDVLANGRVAFSTATNVFVMTPAGGRNLKHSQVYLLTETGEVTLLVDADSRGIHSLNALDVENLVVLLDDDTIRWSGLATAKGYDIIQGDLFLLHAFAGDYALATVACLADNLASDHYVWTTTPDPGQGLWLLVRPDQGSYDSEGFHQVGSRDVGVGLSAVGCP